MDAPGLDTGGALKIGDNRPEGMSVEGVAVQGLGVQPELAAFG
jgi:hypothetical protein